MMMHALSAGRASWVTKQHYAHRGLWSPGVTPENSLAAFAAAARNGLGVELDVRMSADGEPIVFHDPTLDRMTKARGPTSSRTAAELTRLELMGSKETIPLLRDALAMLKETPALIELKVNPGVEGPLERKVAGLLEEHNRPVAVMSFNAASLAELARIAPHLVRGQLCEGWRRTPIFPWSRRAAVRAFVQAYGPKPDFIACQTNVLKHFGRPAADALRSPLLAWTVRTPAQLARARQYADAIIFELLEPATVRGETQPEAALV